MSLSTTVLYFNWDTLTLKVKPSLDVLKFKMHVLKVCKGKNETIFCHMRTCKNLHNPCKI